METQHTAGLGDVTIHKQSNEVGVYENVETEALSRLAHRTWAGTLDIPRRIGDD